MIYATVIDALTGQVLSSGTTGSIEGLAGAGEAVIEQQAPTVEGCWWDGQAFQTVPQKPAGRVTWSWASKQWSDQRTLEQTKAAKNAEINAARAAANQTYFTYAGKQIAVDALSRSDIDAANGIISLTGALPGGWPGAWKTVDNSYVLLSDVAAWTSFFTAMVAQGTANFQHSQTLKAALASAATVAEVDAITWSPT